MISACLPKQDLGLDWSYFPLSPQIHTQLSPQDDGTYELIILVISFSSLLIEAPELTLLSSYFLYEQSTETHRCSLGYETEYKSQIYHTKDLVIPHPHLPSYVQVIGRLDDQITLSNSEKTNP